MKWVNHQVLTGVIVYAATDDMLLTIYSMAGAIFPDKVEGNPHAGNYWSWRSRHRGWSHWPLLYLGLIFFLSRLEEGQLTALPTADLTTIGIYICIGALLHIAEDAVCGKVPLLRRTRKSASGSSRSALCRSTSSRLQLCCSATACARIFLF